MRRVPPKPASRPSRPLRGALLLLAAVIVVVAIFVVGLLSGDDDQGIGDAFADGLSAVGKPFANFAGWSKDTADANGEVEMLRRRVAEARATNGELRAQVSRLPKIQHLERVIETANLATTDPLLATVTAQDPQRWATTVGIGIGRSDGIEVDQPVIGADEREAALIGFVSRVRATSATVTLLPTIGTSVSARIPTKGGASLTLRGIGGATSPDLLLDFANASVRLTRGTIVTTSGTGDAPAPLASRAPRGIPIGKITRAINAGSDGQTAEVRPLIDYRAVETVYVLRRTTR